MGVTIENLKKLTEEMPYKWRLQSAKYGKATIVAYVDNRQVQDKLDEVCGAGNWQNDFREIKGLLFAGLGINVYMEDGNTQWVWKWDTGTEANMEAEKSIVSDSMKRCAVEWGIGRFLYRLKILELKTKDHKGKEYPCDEQGNILWGSDALNEYCNKLVSGRVKATTAKGVAKPIPAKEEPKSAIQPSTQFDDSKKPGLSEDKTKALTALKALDQAKVLAFLIKEKKFKYTTIQEFVESEKIETIRACYAEFTAKK